jgi:type IV pilus biogenesis protein CpaD/CtpE
MNMKPYPLFAIAFLALAACRPAATEWTESEAPKYLRLDNASASVNVRFAPGSAHVLPGDAARLRSMVATGAIQPSDRVMVAVGGSPALAEARRDSISAVLLPYGIVTSPSGSAGLSSDHAVVEIGRYLVTTPACPNWSKAPGTDFTNSFPSNWACTTQTNLGQMVAYPSDLVSGQPLSPALGPTEVTAVDRYLTDRVKPPRASSASSGGAGAGAGGGAGGGGSSDNTGSQ